MGHIKEIMVIPYNLKDAVVSWCSEHISICDHITDKAYGGVGWTVGTVGGRWYLQIDDKRIETFFLLHFGRL